MTSLTKHEHADWCNYKHGRCECGAVDQKQPKEATTPEPCEWLIRKRGYYYRPNRAGYTASVAEAGRYTKAEAENEAALEPWHMAAVHESAVSEPRLPTSKNVTAVEALKVLVEEIDPTGVYLDSPKDAVKFIAQCVSSALTRLIQQETSTELPESLRDPIKVMERGQEMLDKWGPTPVTDAALSGDSSAPVFSYQAAPKAGDLCNHCGNVWKVMPGGIIGHECNGLQSADNTND